MVTHVIHGQDTCLSDKSVSTNNAVDGRIVSIYLNSNMCDECLIGKVCDTRPAWVQASGPAQQMLGVESFPELAAMEAEFQASLARGLLQSHTQAAAQCLLVFVDGVCHHQCCHVGLSIREPVLCLFLHPKLEFKAAL